jgi:hypothetical protein
LPTFSWKGLTRLPQEILQIDRSTALSASLALVTFSLWNESLILLRPKDVWQQQRSLPYTAVRTSHFPGIVKTSEQTLVPELVKGTEEAHSVCHDKLVAGRQKRSRRLWRHALRKRYRSWAREVHWNARKLRKSSENKQNLDESSRERKGAAAFKALVFLIKRLYVCIML